MFQQYLVVACDEVNKADDVVIPLDLGAVDFPSLQQATGQGNKLEI